MKFSTPEGKLETPELTVDYEAAQRFEKTRVGALGVFFPSGETINKRNSWAVFART